MLLDETMRLDGATLFRWRSTALLLFLPLIFLAVRQAEPLERQLGEFWGETFEDVCIILVVAGLALRALTVGFVPARTSGRNTRGQVASVLNTTGAYSLTRNPLLPGKLHDLLRNHALHAGPAAVAELCLVPGHLLRAHHLGGGGLPRRALRPGLSRVDRQGSRVPAAAERVAAAGTAILGTLDLRREYPGWLAAVLALAAIDLSGDFFGMEGERLIEDEWVSISAALIVLSLALHALRRVGLLDSPGR